MKSNLKDNLNNLKVSDIYTAVMAVPGVNWCLVTSPTNNIEVKQNELMTLQGVTVNEVIKDIKRRLNVGSVMVLKQTAEVFDY